MFVQRITDIFMKKGNNVLINIVTNNFQIIKTITDHTNCIIIEILKCLADKWVNLFG